MAKPTGLRVADFRAIRDLTQECRELGDDPGLWRQHWFHRLGQLCGAELVVGGDITVSEGGAQPTHSVEWGWENGFDRAAFLRAFSLHQSELTNSPMIDAYFRRSTGADGAGLSRVRLVPDRAWYDSPYFQLTQQTIGINHTLLSFLASPGSCGGTSGITLSRGADVRRDFSPRECEVLREAHAWVAPLIGGALAGFGEPSPTQLPPRVRQVLRCFLEGDSDKRVVTRLGISRHTVNEYAKAIYRHFGVASRGELLARWVRRRWGAKCAWAEGL